MSGPSKITAAQQDYLEVILRLQEQSDQERVRVTDIANELGTRMPTVTRTVQRLAEKGLLAHRRGGTVRLTAAGRRMAGEILHLHEDLVLFLTEILGLSKGIALRDACQLEHGCSRQTAQRLHEFLEFYESLPEKERRPFRDFTSQKRATSAKFRNLPGIKIHGWRS